MPIIFSEIDSDHRLPKSNRLGLQSALGALGISAASIAAAVLLVGLCLISRVGNAVSADLYVQPGPIDAVNLLSRPYAYEEKDLFTETILERLEFFDAAMKNWKETPATAKDEAKAYAQRAQTTIAPLLEKAKTALSKAQSAGSSDWQSAQAESRKTFLATQRAYQEMHGNTLK